MPRELLPMKENGATLMDIVDRILDKGLVINADITVSVVGVELLGIKIRATIASFETAARYGLEFPSGTNIQMPAWQEAQIPKERCPQCEMKIARQELLELGCRWCGWVSAWAEAQLIPAR